MNSDVAFRIGSTHQVCQDYGRSGSVVFGDKACHYAIVSDGCSSSPDTDIGSRLMVLAAESLIKEKWPGATCRGQLDIGANEVVQRAMDFSQAMDKPKGSKLFEGNFLDATLGVVLGNQYGARAFLMGDGLIVFKSKATTHVTHVSSDLGYPNYPSYLLNAERRAAVKSLIKGSIRRGQLRESGIDWSHTGEMDLYTSRYTVEVDKVGIYESVAIMTDGAESFMRHVETETSRTETPVELHNILNQMLDFKGYQGIFVQRRMQKFAKDCKALGWSHYDDLTVGAVHLGGTQNA